MFGWIWSCMSIAFKGMVGGFLWAILIIVVLGLIQVAAEKWG